jgi:chromosome segregation ATPase
MKTIIHDKETAELSSDYKSRELDSAKQRINNLENRLTANQKEKEQMANEISDLRHSLLKAKEKAENEANQRIHLEKSLDSVRLLDASENETLKLRLQQINNDMITLKNTINHLNKDNKEKDNQYINEMNKRIKLEDDVIKMKKSFDNLTREHSKMSDRFSINRVEKVFLTSLLLLLNLLFLLLLLGSVRRVFS